MKVKTIQFLRKTAGVLIILIMLGTMALCFYRNYDTLVESVGKDRITEEIREYFNRDVVKIHEGKNEKKIE